jgi:hypothetical protein
MREETWVVCANAEPMLHHLLRFGTASATNRQRRLRLFACACCRLIWLTHPEGPCRLAVEAAERFADEEVGQAELDAAREAIRLAYRDEGASGSRALRAGHLVTLAAEAAARKVVPFVESVLGSGPVARPTFTSTPSLSEWALAWDKAVQVLGEPRRRARAMQAALLRDIFHNPFHAPPSLPPAVLAWNDSTVTRIAQGIYEDRAFDRLPILADALLDAGCEDDELIRHCRSEGPRVRGCWAVDLIQGKS